MKRYTVKAGDNLSRIAKAHGLRSWREVYFHRANSGFRQIRPNPNLIYPGDLLSIPNRGSTGIHVPRASAPRPVNSKEDADVVDLEQASAELALENARADAAGRQWLPRIASVLKSLPFEAAQRMHQQGVEAVLFGHASVSRAGERHVRTELDGIQLKVKVSPKPQRHDGTRLYRNDRVSTMESDGGAIVFFLPDLSMIRLREKSMVVVRGASTAPARRQTRSARLEKGVLAERLSEL